MCLELTVVLMLSNVFSRTLVSALGETAFHFYKGALEGVLPRVSQREPLHASLSFILAFHG